MPSSNYYLSNNNLQDAQWYDSPTYRMPLYGSPGAKRQKADEANRSRQMTEEELFMKLFGDGSFNSGPIGGTDRQYSGGQLHEYKGIGDANYDMGGRWKRGNNEVPLFTGLTASDVYKKGGPKTKTVHWDQEPNLWQMFMHPYDAERWGDYLPGSDEAKEKALERDRFKFGGSIAGVSGADRIMDKIKRLRMGHYGI